MAEHVHRCLRCAPEMVPDYSKDDPRYHDGEKCGVVFTATVNGAPVAYTRGVMEGPEGWALCPGDEPADVHICPCTANADAAEICAEPLFGRVEVRHACPASLVRDPSCYRLRWLEDLTARVRAAINDRFGARHVGGIIDPETCYIVGEKGPEVFRRVR